MSLGVELSPVFGSVRSMVGPVPVRSVAVISPIGPSVSEVDLSCFA